VAQIVVEGLAELRQALARMNPALDKSLQQAIGDSAKLGAAAIAGNAPVRSGMLKGSVRAFTEGPTIGGVEVTARKRSRSYPGGYPYPAKVDRRRQFFKRGIAEAAPKVQKRLEKVLDDIARAFGGS
jgi:hypothetical protein